MESIGIIPCCAFTGLLSAASTHPLPLPIFSSNLIFTLGSISEDDQLRIQHLRKPVINLPRSAAVSVFFPVTFTTTRSLSIPVIWRLKRTCFQVKNNLRYVFCNTFYGRKLMVHPVNTDRSNGQPFVTRK